LDVEVRRLLSRGERVGGVVQHNMLLVIGSVRVDIYTILERYIILGRHACNSSLMGYVGL